MNVTDFDYDLPEKYIAQTPSQRRDASRLMVVDRQTGKIYHEHFYNILDHLGPSDCLVLNDSKVLPARIFGIKKETGARVEFLLIRRVEGDRWETMVRPGKKLKPGDTVSFEDVLSAEIMDYGSDGTRIVDFSYEGIFMEKLEQIGHMPLPPYIHRTAGKEDKDRYQTIYCREEGSVAAPTAGLHFTKELLDKIKEIGVKIVYVTLHVGIGTFRPVKADQVEDHHMHFEEYEISGENARIINETRASGGRIISVGTTSTRTLESAADGEGFIVPGRGSTDIFIYPGYKFRVVDSLITNFHLPKSTLMMLISAFYDREKIMEAYEEAKKEGYRFFSYGDAMFIV